MAHPVKQKGRKKSEVIADYDGFVDKFKPKKTTDDCYTPQPVYDAVLRYVQETADVEGLEIVRPFYPGGDYESYPYPENAVVVDNPPFSILAKIRRFYQSRGIRYFLFAPHLTMGSCVLDDVAETLIAVDADVVYENGAHVSTSFVSNLYGDVRLMTSPRLYSDIKEAQEVNEEKKLPKYVYPDSVISTARLGPLSSLGVDFSVLRSECCFTRRLDAQASIGKAIFGGGFLVSESAGERFAKAKADAEKAKADAEKARAIIFELSEREMEVVRKLGNDADFGELNDLC